MKKIDKKQNKILDIIQKSGHNHHLAVADFLIENDWEVEVGSYYTDPITKKPREIDIIAKKKFGINKSFDEDSVTLRLIIECKKIDAEHVLWFRQKDMSKANKFAKNNVVLRHESLSDKDSHYLNNVEVMKLVGKTGNADPFYDSMNGCINALIFYKYFIAENKNNILDIPLIILDSFAYVYKYDVNMVESCAKVNNCFQMEVDYSYENLDGQFKLETFFIDILQKDDLANFLKELEEQDIVTIKRVLTEKKYNREIQQMRNRMLKNDDRSENFFYH